MYNSNFHSAASHIPIVLYHKKTVGRLCYSKYVEKPAYTPSKLPFLKNAIPSLFVLSVLFTGLTAGSVLLQQKQDIRNKAAELPLEETQKTITQTYISQYGYQISFDPTFWTSSQDLADKNLQEVTFLLQKEGIAQVKIQISPPPKAQSPVKSEKITRAGKDLNKLTYEESSLGQTSIYYRYEIEIGVNTLVIEAKYPQLDSVSAVFAEKFVDSILETTFGNNQVKGISSSYSESQAIELAKPSIVNITHLYCNTVTANKDKTVFLKQEYVICNNAKGTGFIINKEGYIATNGHVVQVFPEETLTKAFFENQGALATDIVREIFLNFENRRISSSDAEIILANSRNNPLFFNSLLSYAYNLLDQKAISTNRKDSIYFINTGTEPIDIDFEKLQKGQLPTQNTLLTSQSVKAARLVGYDYPNRYTPNAILHNKLPLGSDVAILKLEGGEKTSLPILKLGTTDTLKDGDPLLVIGYPGLVEGFESPGSLINYSSSVKPTITRGVVSSVKTDQAGNKLIQTDASIERGNSGGPALNINSEVVGIATYGFASGSGNYNFLRDVEDLKKLAKKYNVSTSGESESSTLWAKGLKHFWSGQYKKAIPFFQKAQLLFPSPIFQEYIEKSQQAVKDGKNINVFQKTFSSTPISAVIFLLLAGLTGGAATSLLIITKTNFFPKTKQLLT
ncbi:MAG: hypothetical protein A2782_02340 [Candidatus Blackburnbacteria bacterium RIFCSPHIGHO2_01_FULL_43_15b]|uniref:Serine protease n=1 Tax=Candidatus Blackburnbacteria bacterium RIFCSPHIGHO2_01_FULL_43_15b TaxID=1797513 RepID=A0A1G1V087_9BACT|nr:MAG: hypothetical protein A2782_02340 [Candidatus Blackburnbacteria bacterium RIFCSPHIGHO2_01_FULL_43_15b]